MATPQSVFADSKRADELIKQVYGNPGEPAADAGDSNQQGTETQGQSPSPAVGQERQPDAAGVVHDWKERFTGLQRTHAATVSELKQARADYARLAADMAELRSRLDAQPAPAQQRQAGFELSDEERTLFGDDNLHVVEKVARQIAEQRLAEEQEKQKRERDLAQAKANAQRAATETKNDFLDRLKSRLSEAKVDFAQVDADPGFEAWMKEVDPREGVARSELLARAYRANIVGAAATFYTDFVASKTPRDPREELVQPKTQGNPSSAAPDAPKGKIWRQSEVNAFYHDRTMGKYRKDPETARAIEKDIFDALATGRVRPG